MDTTHRSKGARYRRAAVVAAILSVVAQGVAVAASADAPVAAVEEIPGLALPDPFEVEPEPGERLPRFMSSSLSRIVVEEERAISPYEPMYFVVGGGGDGTNDVTARFQLSFKYRFFDPDSFVSDWLPPETSLYLAYTQTSLWNWSADSAPFEDTTYRPSLFLQRRGSERGLLPDLWRGGFEHASNGQSAEYSRSVNTLFLRPIWWTEIGGRELIFAPKFFSYVEKSDNPDIDDYRGNATWLLRYGSETSWTIQAEVRRDPGDRGYFELSYSYPIRQPIFYRAGGFFYAQYLQGYGESLLEYDVERDPTLRIGFAIVR